MSQTDPKTTIDWLRVRVQSEPREALEALRPMYGTFGSGIRLKPLERGILGFQQACQIEIGDMALGRMDFGGAAQRGWCRIDIPAKGCEWVQDWAAVRSLEDLERAEPRRVDIALTTWNGEMTHDKVVQAHQDGRFITRGRPPNLNTRINSDPRLGRTCYVGKREKSDKFFRAYEKGHELLVKCGAKLSGINITHIDGSKVEDIYRCELELKAETSDIPWEVIERRDQYFAGAYPFCADVLPGVEADILKRRPDREIQMTLAAALENCRIQYGPTLFTALKAYGGDMTTIWDKIIGHHHSQPLLEAGVLLVDHE